MIFFVAIWIWNWRKKCFVGETSDNQRRGVYAGHCGARSGHEEHPSIGQWGHLCEFTGRWRTGCKREISHPSHGVERPFSWRKGVVAHFARRKTLLALSLPLDFSSLAKGIKKRDEELGRRGNGAMKRRKCMMHTLHTLAKNARDYFWLTSPFLGDRVFDWWDWARLVRGCTFSYYANKA